ncbi:hypothetical protein D3C85_1269360 [compost metagenome]
MTQFGKQRSFQGFHFFGLIIVDVVVAQQVQATVDHQVRPMGLQRLALFGRFALDHLDANHQVAQQRDIQHVVGHVRREGQHIGGIVLVAVGVVEFAAFGFVDQANGHFRIGTALAQGQLAPAAKIGIAWARRGAGPLQIKLKHRGVYPRPRLRWCGHRSAHRPRRFSAPTGGEPRPWA